MKAHYPSRDKGRLAELSFASVSHSIPTEYKLGCINSVAAPLYGTGAGGRGGHNVPRGTMDEVSSYVRLGPLSVRRQGRPKDCSASSSNPMIEWLEICRYPAIFTLDRRSEE